MLSEWEHVRYFHLKSMSCMHVLKGRIPHRNMCNWDMQIKCLQSALDGTVNDADLIHHTANIYSKFSLYPINLDDV